MIFMRWMCVLAVIAAGVLTGCDGSNGFDESSQAPASRIAPKSGWMVQARGVQNADYAIDGNPSTYATTPEGYREAALTIDLGEPSLFNMLVVDHGDEADGFARRLVISTSMDGQTYKRRAIAPGNRVVSNVCIVTPVLARYVRIEVIESWWQPWSVAEIQLK